MESYPATLGEYVILEWTMTALCYDCTGTYKFPINVRAALNSYGPGYPTADFMQGQMCQCGRKLLLYCFSPEDRAPVSTPRR